MAAICSQPSATVSMILEVSFRRSTSGRRGRRPGGLRSRVRLTARGRGFAAQQAGQRDQRGVLCGCRGGAILKMAARAAAPCGRWWPGGRGGHGGYCPKRRDLGVGPGPSIPQAERMWNVAGPSIPQVNGLCGSSQIPLRAEVSKPAHVKVLHMPNLVQQDPFGLRYRSPAQSRPHHLTYFAVKLADPRLFALMLNPAHRRARIRRDLDLVVFSATTVKM